MTLSGRPASGLAVPLLEEEEEPPPEEDGDPDDTLDLCNTVIETGNRDAITTGGIATPGQTVAFVITNNVHDARSVTNAYFTIAANLGGIAYTVYDAVMIPGEQGPGFPTPPWPGRSGTFVVPSIPVAPGFFGVTTKSDYTGSGGPALADECWRVELWYPDVDPDPDPDPGGGTPGEVVTGHASVDLR